MIDFPTLSKFCEYFQKFVKTSSACYTVTKQSFTVQPIAANRCTVVHFWSVILKQVITFNYSYDAIWNKWAPIIIFSNNSNFVIRPLTNYLEIMWSPIQICEMTYRPQLFEGWINLFTRWIAYHKCLEKKPCYKLESDLSSR